MISQEQRRIMYRGLATKGRLAVDAEELASIDARLAEDPLDYYLWTARAVVCGSTDEAIRCYSIALGIQPLASHSRYNRGRKYMGQDRFEEGLADLRTATALDPDDGWKWHFQGVALYFLERYDEAIASFETAIEVNQRNEEPLLPFEVDWLWNCHHQAGDREAADRCLTLVGPDTPVVDTEATYKRRILLYRGLLDEQDYLGGIDRADVAEAGNQLYGLANHRFRQLGDVEGSVQLLRQVLDLDPAKSGWGRKMAARDLPLRVALRGGAS
ncbi:tetratricopeptide repeat protein [Nakamurella leprariae]|uniref:Tetratricopeptide repeat protein n=1 Tax=Nakamurella leprariae TaxID=2803911 RepID=A0A938YFF9_9ACTN|nr:tetratricopeptide repeat protein [Nakamurella leprariae]MBM9468561.1 tetratricopeptide repeat protein [Nakamurella leprariae]